MNTKRLVVAWVGIEALYLALALRMWWVCDDAWISFRYSHHFAQGNGLRYNLGEHTPVEGYSNFLWTVLASGVEYIGRDPGLWMPLISLFCGAVLVVYAPRSAQGVFRLSDEVTALGGLTLATLAPISVWATSGLETMPWALLAFICFERLVWARGEHSWVGGAFGGIGLALIRTEGIYWFILILALAILARLLEPKSARRYQGLLQASAMVFAVYGAYWISRYNYYGLAFANTAYAKADFSWLGVSRGLKYVTGMFAVLATPILFLAGTRRALDMPVAGLPLILFALCFPAYAVVVGGDYMTMGRLLVPAMAPLTLLWMLVLGKLMDREGWTRTKVVALALGVCVIGVLPIADLAPVPTSVREMLFVRHNNDQVLTEYGQWEKHVNSAANWGARGADFRTLAEPGDTVVTSTIGAFGYAVPEVTILDQCGLVSTSVARASVVQNKHRSPGHEKCVKKTFFSNDAPIWWGKPHRVHRERDVAKLVHRLGEGDFKQSYAPKVVPVPSGMWMVALRKIDASDSKRLWAEHYARYGRYEPEASAGK